MRGVTYAFLGPEDQAGKYAKKGTTSDVTLFNAKKGDDALNLVTASRYPEKLASLCLALDLADEVVLQPAQLDKTLGEQVVGCELFGKTRGFLRAGDHAAQLGPILARTALKDLTPGDEPEGVFRERLWERVASSTSGPLVCAIDHSFPVKGVGTVLLGLVRSGEIHAHDALQAFPTERVIDVRSIQVHDVDQKSAPTHARVGLAVKGVEATDVPRGTVLAPKGSLQVLPAGQPATLPVQLHPFNKWTPKAGTVLHVFHVLQDAVLRIDAADTRSITGTLEQPLAVVPGQPAVLLDLDNKVQRFVGRATLPG